jgi:hypothetical protein
LNDVSSFGPIYASDQELLEVTMRDWINASEPSARRLGSAFDRSIFHSVLCAVACCAATFSLPAQAVLVSPIDVSLVAPGGFTNGIDPPDTTPLLLNQSVGYGTPITPAGGGAIGGFMLPGEQVALNGDSVRIRVAQGSELGGTGYLGLGGVHARYELSGLAIAGSTITGFTLYTFDGYGTSGFSGASSGVGVSFVDSADADSAPDLLIFNLDDLLFVDRGLGNSLNFAEFRIDILSRLDNPPPPPPPNGVPEPGTLALAAAALLALRSASRRQSAKNH